MFLIDNRFPDFSLEVYHPDTDEEGMLSLDDVFADQACEFLILFFYPADFTYICPTELADLARRAEDFKKYHTRVVVVSTDTVYTHKAWLEHEKALKNVTYTMAADHNGKLSRELGIYGEQRGLAQRATFVIDRQKMLRATDIVSDNIGRSATELLRKVKALYFVAHNPGQVCPASWDEGATTLTPSIKIAGKVGEQAGMGE
jgi:peroxiredoxin (alkyl hydroperoxide reductase subunit C)